MERRYSPGLPAHLWGACNNDISGEIEVPEFLYALVRLTKPAVCFELGSGMGLTTRAIGEALRDNGRGMLLSVDHDPAMLEEARSACLLLPVQFLRARTADLLLPMEDLDFVLIDSGEPVERLMDFEMIEANIAPVNGIVAVHDTGMYGELGQSLAARPGWRSLFFPTPLGLTLMQKEPS